MLIFQNFENVLFFLNTLDKKKQLKNNNVNPSKNCLPTIE